MKVVFTVYSFDEEKVIVAAAPNIKSILRNTACVGSDRGGAAGDSPHA